MILVSFQKFLTRKRLISFLLYLVDYLEISKPKKLLHAKIMFHFLFSFSKYAVVQKLW